MTKCCSGNDSRNFSLSRHPYKQHQSTDPLLVSISVLLQNHNGQMILERAPLSPKLLDSEIARSQARSNTHKEWATERLLDLKRGDTATPQRFSLSVKEAPAPTSTQGQGNVKTIDDQSTRPNGRPTLPANSHPSTNSTFPHPLSEPIAYSKETNASPTLDPTTPFISCYPTAVGAFTPTTGNQNNNNNGNSVSWQLKAHGIKQASTAERKLLGAVFQIKKEETTSNTRNSPHHTLVCDEIATQYTPMESNTTNNHPQTDSSENVVHHAENWKWLPPKLNHERYLLAIPKQPTHIPNWTVSDKEEPCDTPTKAATTKNYNGLPKITNPHQCANTLQENTHHSTPPTALTIPHIPTTGADHPIRTDHQSCPRRNHNHSNDRPNPLLWNTGDQGMAHDPNPSERAMDLEPTPSSPTMCLD